MELQVVFASGTQTYELAEAITATCTLTGVSDIAPDILNAKVTSIEPSPLVAKLKDGSELLLLCHAAQGQTPEGPHMGFAELSGIDIPSGEQAIWKTSHCNLIIKDAFRRVLQ